jgi:5S rRNA maturation endonuclease (ribonuclease M5)
MSVSAVQAKLELGAAHDILWALRDKIAELACAQAIGPVTLAIIPMLLLVYSHPDKYLIPNTSIIVIELKTVGILGSAGVCFHDVEDCLETERKNVTAERDAFLEFAEQVQSISESTAHSSATVARNVSCVNTNSNNSLEQIREQYQETVFSLTDFDDKYGESFEEHITAEFGPRLARVLTAGTEFTSHVKQLVIQQARESAQRREQLLEIIAAENCSIQSVRQGLTEAENDLNKQLETSYEKPCLDELITTYDTLQIIKSNCGSLLHKRQEDIQSIARDVGGRVGMFQEYVYESLHADYPALYSILSYLQVLDRQSSEICEQFYSEEF